MKTRIKFSDEMAEHMDFDRCESWNYLLRVMIVTTAEDDGWITRRAYWVHGPRKRNLDF